MADAAQNDSKSAFDFEAAAVAARRDYGAETQGMSFINLSRPEAASGIKNWFVSVAKVDWTEAEAAQAANTAAQASGLMRRAGGYKLLAVPATPKKKFLGPSSTPASEAAFAFNHELGHAVVKNGTTAEAVAKTPLNEIARAEIAADVFAVLRGIATGTLSREQAQHLSLARALQAPGAHTTSQAIDAVLVENSDDKIKALSAADITAYAEKYAALHMPQPGELEELAKKLQWVRMQEITFKQPPAAVPESLGKKLKNLFGKIASGPKSARAAQGQMVTVFLSEDQWLENVAAVFKTAPQGTLTAHVTEKILSAAFNGTATGKKFDVSNEKWDGLRKSLASRKQQPTP